MEYTLIKNGESTEWKTYVIEGTIKKDTRGILIGGWAEYNGQFLFARLCRWKVKGSNTIALRT
jgi:hypothetical protein